MKKGVQRAFAITIAVLMIFSTIALVFPAFSVPSQPTPSPAAPAQIEVTSIETEPVPQGTLVAP